MTAGRPTVADPTAGRGPSVVGTGTMALDLARMFGGHPIADPTALPPARKHYVLVPPAPESLSLTAAGDDALVTELGDALRNCVYALQRLASLIDSVVAPHVADADPDYDGPIQDEAGQDSGSITIVLPAAATLGEAGYSVTSAFCGGVLSLARTLAIELRRQHIRVNTLMVDQHLPGVVASVATQVTALMSMPGVTGQEIYLADGLDCGRIRP